MRSHRLVAFLVIAQLLLSSVLHAGDWPQWRGPTGMGISDERGLPMTWSKAQNVRWRTPLPEPGNSTPIVWQDRVFITQAIEHEGRRSVMCFDRSTGKLLWQSGVTYTEKEPTHRTNPYCSASPVTDGERVIASFGSAGLACYDFEGKELWRREFGPMLHVWGNASSPILYENLCIFHFGPGERTFLIAIDKRTGETVWQVDEPGGMFGHKSSEWIGSWSTPVVLRVGVQDQLIMSYPTRLCAFDPRTGKELWTASGLGNLVYTSPIHADGILVSMSGYHGPAIAVRTGGTGDVTESHRLWVIPRSPQRIGSGVIHDRHVYILNDPGVAQCIELESGKVVWEHRLEGSGNHHTSWSSMVVADGHLYAVNHAGDTFVLRASPEFELVATNSLGERTLSSLALAHGDIFIRTYEALWCIGSN